MSQADYSSYAIPVPAMTDLRMVLIGSGGGRLQDVRLDERSPNPMRLLRQEFDVGKLADYVNESRPHACPTCYLSYKSAEHAEACCWVDPQGRRVAPIPPSLETGRPQGVALDDENVEAVRILTGMGWPLPCISAMLGRVRSQVAHTYECERKRIMDGLGLRTPDDWRLWQSRHVTKDCPQYAEVSRHARNYDFATDALARGLDVYEAMFEYRVTAGKADVRAMAVVFRKAVAGNAS